MAWIWSALVFVGSLGSPVPQDEQDPAPNTRESVTPEKPEGQEAADDPGEEKDVARAPEVVVTASRTPRASDQLPYRVTERSGDWIQTRRLARSLPEALQEETGIFVQKTGPGQISPFIRGFTGFHTLTLIDGIRLNNAVFRPGPNQYLATIDSFSVDRLEIVRGPASVQWGSDAVGGTLNAIVKERRDFPEGIHVFGRVFQRWASAEKSSTTRVETQGNFDEAIGYHLGMTYRTFGSIDGGQHVGEQSGTGYEEWAGDTKWRFVVNERLDWTFGFQQMTQSDVPRTHATVQGISWRGTTIGEDLRRDFDQERQLVYTQLEYENESDDTWLQRGTLSLSWQRQHEVERRDRSGGRFRRQGFTDRTLGAWLQLESPLAGGRLAYGGEIYLDQVDSFRRDFDSTGAASVAPRGPVADDGDYTLSGVFVQHEAEVAEGVHTTAGVRYSFARATADEVDPDPSDATFIPALADDYESVVWNARVLFDASEALRPYVGISTAFRAPNLSDLTRFDTARSGEVELGAPDLDPERFTSYEVGAHFRHRDTSASLAVFFTDVNNLIIRFPTGVTTTDGEPVVTLDNSGRGFVHGVEAAGDVPMGKDWRLFGNFTWLEGEVDQFIAPGVKDREPISRLMPTTGLVGLGWEHPDGNVHADFLAQFVGEADRLSERDKSDTERIPPGGTPGYTVLTLRGGVRVSENVSVFGAIENLANRDYRVHGSGINAPGTNVILGLDLTF